MRATFQSIDQAMSYALENVMSYGMTSSPRGKPVREILGQSVSFDMRFPVVTRESRKIGARFYPAEAAWILSGRNDLQFFKDLNMPFVWPYSDDGVYYQGAYGPKVIDQLIYVCDALADDPDTRQAVIDIWRPNPRPSKDVPCTLSYQFLARGGALHCVQSMRSSDVWLGYPYDAFNAAMLTAYIVLLLRERKDRGRQDLGLGYHTLVVGSQHVYEEQWESAIEFVQDRSGVDYAPFDPKDYDDASMLLENLKHRASDKNGVNPRVEAFYL